MSKPNRRYVIIRNSNEDYHQTYIELADHPHELNFCVHKTVRVQDFIQQYSGPGIAVDLDENNRAVGIEIIYSYNEDEEENE